jgi:hypothetical protein
MGLPALQVMEVMQFACRWQEKGKPLSGGKKADFGS